MPSIHGLMAGGRGLSMSLGAVGEAWGQRAWWRGREGAGLTWDSCVDVIYLPLPTGFFWYGG